MATVIFWSRRVKYFLVGLLLFVLLVAFCSNLLSSRSNYLQGHVDISNYFMDIKQQPLFYSNDAWKKVDEVDNSAATVFLKKYKGLFGNSSSPDPDPNQPETINTWWEAAAMIDWYMNTSFRYSCLQIKYFAGWDLCQDIPYHVKPPCLVYSFGIRHQFLFDKDMEKLGCEVHSFAPSIDKGDGPNRGLNTTYHSISLGSIDTDEFIPRKEANVGEQQFWTVRTLRSLIRTLGHEKRTIDVLKLDIDGHEWEVIDNMMQTDVFKYVRQFMLEFHLFPDWPVKDQYVHMFQTYTRLRELGFREYKVSQHSKNLSVNSVNLIGDVEFVNVFFEIKTSQK